MPDKTKEQPGPIRPELIYPLTEILRDRRPDIGLWPADETAAYRDNGRYREGHDAAQRVRLAKAAAAIDEPFKPLVSRAFTDGVLAAQSMTGFTDETLESILEKEGIVGRDGSAL